ncbi:MAG: iron-sulfur cluster insertion protein ErpA [Abitibacteriaceae bacterium]|nr:iron-sulfur cluster insertion protein ErpA [Abditibacteriaceae bacterium]
MIKLSDRAATEIKGLLEKQGKDDALLRVFVAGGGCSGFQYGMSLEDEAMEGDQQMDINGVKVIIDPRSMMYIQGAEVDYVDSIMGGGFKIDNPNAVSSCGCGHSFTPKEGAEGEAEAVGAQSGGGCGSCGSHGY